jgi:hypothetical protein
MRSRISQSTVRSISPIAIAPTVCAPVIVTAKCAWCALPSHGTNMCAVVPSLQ